MILLLLATLAKCEGWMIAAIPTPPPNPNPRLLRLPQPKKKKKESYWLLI